MLLGAGLIAALPLPSAAGGATAEFAFRTAATLGTFGGADGDGSRSRGKYPSSGRCRACRRRELNRNFACSKTKR